MKSEDRTVFIHYSWDNGKHKKWVLDLANKLTKDGLNVMFDRFDVRVGSNITYFMEKLREATKVIIIMSPLYKTKVDERKGGSGYEYQIVTNELSKSLTNNNKFVPVLRSGDKSTSVPTLLGGFLFIDMTKSNFEDKSYLELLRALYDEPEVIRPLIGNKPDFDSLKKTKYSSENISNIKDLFNFGMSKKQVRRLLGKPQEDHRIFECYYSHGIDVYYNKHDDFVDGILVKRSTSGILYDGDVFGVKLGDTFGEVKAKLGVPQNWGMPGQYSSFAIYQKNYTYLVFGICRKELDDKILGHYKEGTVHAIAYCTEASFLACEPIVAASMQEIRAGKKPSYMEDKSKYRIEIDLKDIGQHNEYYIQPPQFFLAGGYLINVFFPEEKNGIVFWLYDLGWSKLVIRRIFNFDSASNNSIDSLNEN